MRETSGPLFPLRQRALPRRRVGRPPRALASRRCDVVELLFLQAAMKGARGTGSNMGSWANTKQSNEISKKEKHMAATTVTSAFRRERRRRRLGASGQGGGTGAESTNRPAQQGKRAIETGKHVGALAQEGARENKAGNSVARKRGRTCERRTPAACVSGGRGVVCFVGRRMKREPRRWAKQGQQEEYKGTDKLSAPAAGPRRPRQQPAPEGRR